MFRSKYIYTWDKIKTEPQSERNAICGGAARSHEEESFAPERRATGAAAPIFFYPRNGKQYERINIRSAVLSNITPSSAYHFGTTWPAVRTRVGWRQAVAPERICKWRGAHVRKKSFVVLLHFFGFISTFWWALSWWAVQFGQFIVCCSSSHGAPLCPAICKSGGTCPPCRMESAPLASSVGHEPGPTMGRIHWSVMQKYD